MVEFLRKFEDRDIKIDRVNYNFTFILYGVGGPL